MSSGETGYLVTTPGKALGLLLELAQLQSERLDGVDGRLDGVEQRMGHVGHQIEEVGRRLGWVEGYLGRVEATQGEILSVVRKLERETLK